MMMKVSYHILTTTAHRGCRFLHRSLLPAWQGRSIQFDLHAVRFQSNLICNLNLVIKSLSLSLSVSPLPLSLFPFSVSLFRCAFTFTFRFDCSPGHPFRVELWLLCPLSVSVCVSFTYSFTISLSLSLSFSVIFQHLRNDAPKVLSRSSRTQIPQAKAGGKPQCSTIKGIFNCRVRPRDTPVIIICIVHNV